MEDTRSNGKKREASQEADTPSSTLNKKGRSDTRASEVDPESDTSSPQVAILNNDLKIMSSIQTKDILGEARPAIDVHQTLLDTIDMAQTCLSEEQVGIQCYINTHLTAFSAILKHRFTDFLVYEVDRAGEVVRLKDISEPREPGEEIHKEVQKDPVVSKVEKHTLVSKIAAAKEWPADAGDQLAGILSEQKLEDLKNFVSRGPTRSNRSSHRSKGSTHGRQGPRSRGSDNTSVNKGDQVAAAPSDESKLVNNGSTPQDSLPPSHGDQNIEPAKVGIASEPAESPETNFFLSDSIDCKEQRKKFHQVFREVFQGRLSTTHKQMPGGRAAIEVGWAPPGGNQERKPSMIDLNPPYIHFTLQKTNRETQEALSILSNLLHCHVSRDLGIAGTKDKRSVSCQRVSLKRGRKTIQQVWATVNRVKNRKIGAGPVLFRERGDKGIRLGDFTYEAGPLKLGDSSGNRFIIVLRDVVPTKPKVLTDAVNALSKSGFLNYFGMQRFGTTCVGTHMIGLSLLRGDWTLAIDLIMRRKPGETQDAEHARSIWRQTKDAQATLELMPRRCVAERCILQFFSKQGGQTDKVGALGSIPKNLKMMYIHAYQSYIWNHVLSERVRLYGCDKPVVGDLILAENNASEVVNDEIGGDADLADDEQVSAVKVLGHEDDCQKHTIHDVVLPLIGYQIRYPENALGQMYFDIMKRDGLDPEKLRRSQAEYSMAGTYRKILHMPTDVKCGLYEYEEPDLPLSQADEDVLLGMKLPELVQWTPSSSTTDDPPLKHLALKIELTLGSSAYATMALREILKSDTGKEAQSKMTLRMRARMAKIT